ncbi:MAG: DUF4435 domain-containing protein [Prevotella sp.]|nr:DUF4435 domain-containing protein [Prevotella sp.]
MVDIYKLQATYFANVLTHQTNAIACVHLEDIEDKPFWNALLQSHRSGVYYYISYSRSQKGNDTSGCEQCLKYRPYLSKRFFICIDSDMRYLLQEPDLDAAHFVCQTYSYSWENHYCEAVSLQQRFESQCPEKAAGFDFTAFLPALSKVLYKPLLLLLYYLKVDNNIFTQKMFTACLPKQCQRIELADNGTPLVERIAKNFEQYLNTSFAKDVNYEAESNCCQALNVNEQNAYLHVREHNIFDLVAYIGDLLCRGTSVSFKKDVMMNDLPSQNYWQIQKVASDISTIV